MLSPRTSWLQNISFPKDAARELGEKKTKGKENQRPTLPLFFFEECTQARGMTGKRVGLCSGSVPHLGPAVPRGEVGFIIGQSQAQFPHHSSRRRAGFKDSLAPRG